MIWDCFVLLDMVWSVVLLISLYEFFRLVDDIVCEIINLLLFLVKILMVDGWFSLFIWVIVGLLEVRGVDDVVNFLRGEVVVVVVFEVGMVFGGRDGVCVVIVVFLRFIKEVNEEVGDWERGVCLIGVDMRVLIGSWVFEDWVDKVVLIVLREMGVWCWFCGLMIYCMVCFLVCVEVISEGELLCGMVINVCVIWVLELEFLVVNEMNVCFLLLDVRVVEDEFCKGIWCEIVVFCRGNLVRVLWCIGIVCGILLIIFVGIVFVMWIIFGGGLEGFDLDLDVFGFLVGLGWLSECILFRVFIVFFKGIFSIVFFWFWEDVFWGVDFFVNDVIVCLFIEWFILEFRLCDIDCFFFFFWRFILFDELFWVWMLLVVM